MLEDLVNAYHSLIDLEYGKYRNENRLEDAFHDFNEAINLISLHLSKSFEDAKEIYQELMRRGFIVKIGGSKCRTLHFDIAYRASNVRIEYGSLRYPLEAKIYVKDEEIPRFDDYNFEVLRDLVSPEVYEVLKYAIYKEDNFEERDRIVGFSEFQYKAIKNLLESDKMGYILTAPTSGGKTYAFLLPILIKILEKKLQGKREKYVKAIIIYPRKALERDQLNKIIAILYRINYYLKYIKNIDDAISIGIDDGVTPWEGKVNSRTSYREVLCPSCNGTLEYFVSSKLKGIRCRQCGRIYDWIYGYREKIWESKPDILITNVWTLDFRLPSKTIEYDYDFFNNISIIVLDEAHVYQSLLGGNVRYLLKRLKIASKGKPIIVLSSATMSKPEEFGRRILDMRPGEEFEIIMAGRKRAKKKVIYLIMAVHPQRSWETTVYELAILLGVIFRYRKLQSVMFIDSIREIYRICHQMLKVAMIYYLEPKDHFDSDITDDPEDPYNYRVYIDKENDFNPFITPIEIYNYIRLHHANVPNREEIEKAFKKGKLGVLISTSTLELGVDYPNVSIVAIIGIPFMLESIPQRIGRAGRNAEKTLNTILAIILLRNTPLELYYLHKPEDLIEGFKKKDIPVAWRNIAVKKYHSLYMIFDEMARNGESTYILKTDGKLMDVNEFINKIIVFIDKTKSKLNLLASRTTKDEDIPFKIIEDIRKELVMIPNKIEKWKSTYRCISEAYELLISIRETSRKVFLFARRIGDKKLEEDSGGILKLIWLIISGR